MPSCGDEKGCLFTVMGTEVQAGQVVSIDTARQGKWVLSPPDREESLAFDITPAGLGHCGGVIFRRSITAW